MKSVALLFATAALSEGVVHVLTDDNYKQFIDSHPIVLVHFYTEWCAKCKVLTPKLQAVAFKVKEKGWPVAIAKVDAKAHEEASKLSLIHI